MSIQWFPGHMHLTRKAIAERVKAIDVVIEMLDARLPGSSANPLLADLTGHKPTLKVLNKQEMADPARTEQWLAHYRAQPGTRAIPLDASHTSPARALVAECRELAPLRGGMVKPLRVLICGIPNVGKSTLINTLMGKRAAKTGDEAGVTRNEQRVALADDCYLFDTPGVLWPRIVVPESGTLLAASGAVGRNAYDDESVALDLLDLLKLAYPVLLEERYRFGLNPAGPGRGPCRGADGIDRAAARGAGGRGQGQPDQGRRAGDCRLPTGPHGPHHPGDAGAVRALAGGRRGRRCTAAEGPWRPPEQPFRRPPQTLSCVSRRPASAAEDGMGDQPGGHRHQQELAIHAHPLVAPRGGVQLAVVAVIDHHMALLHHMARQVLALVPVRAVAVDVVVLVDDAHVRPVVAAPVTAVIAAVVPAIVAAVMAMFVAVVLAVAAAVVIGQGQRAHAEGAGSHHRGHDLAELHGGSPVGC